MKSVIILFSAFFLTTTAMAAGSGLSREDVAKVKRFYEYNGLGDGDSGTINPNQLKGAAKTEYVRLSHARECTRDQYCPEAYSFNAYGTETLAVGVADDGGIIFKVYTMRGVVILSCSQGESGTMSCGE